MSTETYDLTVEVRGGLPGMEWLLDVVETALLARGLRPGDYDITVHGPPELQIRMVPR